MKTNTTHTDPQAAGTASADLPDLQAGGPLDARLSLDCVGVTRVERFAELPALGSAQLTVSASVPLSAASRGAHMSRFVEGIDQALESPVGTEPGQVLVTLARQMADVIGSGQGSGAATVSIEARATRSQPAPTTRRMSLAPRNAQARVMLSDEGALEETALSVRVLGMTACPCAQELVRSHARETVASAGHDPVVADAVFDALPAATHNQRGWMTIELSFNGSAENLPELATLEAIASGAMSAPILDTLKRPDERDIVRAAHERPRFVEDAVRDALANLATLPLADKVLATVSLRNEESIHAHDVEASRTATLGMLRAELG